MAPHRPIDPSALPFGDDGASDRFNGQDWSTLFLLLDALLDLPTAHARQSLMDRVMQHAPEYAQELRRLLEVHTQVERTEFLRDGPGGTRRQVAQ